VQRGGFGFADREIEVAGDLVCRVVTFFYFERELGLEPFLAKLCLLIDSRISLFLFISLSLYDPLQQSVAQCTPDQ
jgi:hypothetical protein